MESRIARSAAVVVLAMVASTSFAQQPQQKSPPLAPDALARCATQVQTLRQESARLVQTNAEYEVRRNAYNERTASLKTERDQLKPDDLAGGLAWKQRQQEHQAQLVAFNADVEKLKTDIRAVNVVKRDYDSGCAGRPYRQEDLKALPESAQKAMSTGLGGVQVPTLGP